MTTSHDGASAYVQQRPMNELTEVQAKDVRVGDRLRLIQLGTDPQLGVVTSVSTTDTHPRVTTLAWTDERWIDDTGRQVPSFIGTRGQCFSPEAALRVVRER